MRTTLKNPNSHETRQLDLLPKSAALASLFPRRRESSVHSRLRGNDRRHDSYICHSVCSMHKKYGTDCDHRNRILARTAESWRMERVTELVISKKILEHAVEHAHWRCEKILLPQKEARARLRTALRDNQKEIDTVLGTVTSGRLDEALLGFLNQRARELKWQRGKLLGEQRQLEREILPLSQRIDTKRFEKTTGEFLGFDAKGRSG